jgi:hypothetical protein
MVMADTGTIKEVGEYFGVAAGAIESVWWDNAPACAGSISIQPDTRHKRFFVIVSLG